MTKDKTVTISRDLAERLATPRNTSEGWIIAADAVIELRALLADPVVEHQEPVAQVVSKYGDPESFGEREVVVLVDLSKIPYDTKLYTSPTAPVAVVLPERMEVPRGDLQPFERVEAKAWNACLDKVKELNQ